MSDIDDIDRKILRKLAEDGRISNLALADAVGLSPSACLRRVNSLESAGIITGYRATISREKTGIGFVAYVTVGLNRHTRESQRAFEQAMAAAPQVRECHNITGAVEYLLRVEASDLSSYKHFHTEVLGALPQVNTLQTYVVMGSPKDSRS